MMPRSPPHAIALSGRHPLTGDIAGHCHGSSIEGLRALPRHGELVLAFDTVAVEILIGDCSAEVDTLNAYLGKLTRWERDGIGLEPGIDKDRIQLQCKWLR